MKRVFISMALLFISVIGVNAATLNLCTGGEKGNYEYTGLVLAKQIKQVVDVNVVNTLGSWDNLGKIDSSECDAAVVQSDALYLWNKEEGSLNIFVANRMFGEHVLLLCNRNSGVDDIQDLTGKTSVFAGKLGSGSNVSIRGMFKADEEFGNGSFVDVPLLNEGGIAALAKLAGGGTAACLVSTAAPGTKFMSVNAEKFADDLVLVPIEDKDFNDVTYTDAQGNDTSVWNAVTLPYSAYNKIMPSGMLGRASLDTFGVTAMFVISSKWLEANEEAFGEVAIALPDVKKILKADRGLDLFD